MRENSRPRREAWKHGQTHLYGGRAAVIRTAIGWCFIWWLAIWRFFPAEIPRKCGLKPWSSEFREIRLFFFPCFTRNPDRPWSGDYVAPDYFGCRSGGAEEGPDCSFVRKRRAAVHNPFDRVRN